MPDSFGGVWLVDPHLGHVSLVFVKLISIILRLVGQVRSRKGVHIIEVCVWQPPPQAMKRHCE